MNSKLSQELLLLLNNKFDNNTVQFIQRIKQGNLTIQENPKEHFCVYFAAYNPKKQEVFLGHHKKSGLWLFNGGHIDRGETTLKTLKREIDEEWGIDINKFKIENPALLTITHINNPLKQTCKCHYDIWYFIQTDKKTFRPDLKKLSKEFYVNNWVNLEKAGKIVKDENTLAGINFIAKNYFYDSS